MFFEIVDSMLIPYKTKCIQQVQYIDNHIIYYNELVDVLLKLLILCLHDTKENIFNNFKHN